MKRKTKSIVALLLTMLMVVGLIPTEFVPVKVKAADKTYTFVSNTLAMENNANATAGYYADGQQVSAGTEDYFTLYMSSKTKIDGSGSKLFSDGSSLSSPRVNFGGAADLEAPKNVIKFVTTKTANVKIWWICGDAGRQVAIYDSNKVEKFKSAIENQKNGCYISECQLSEAGTYYLGNTPNNNYIFKVEVTEVSTAPATGTAPVVSTASASLKAGTTDVATVNWELTSKGTGDGKLLLDVIKGDIALQEGIELDQDTTSYDYQMTASGNYTFKVYGKLGSNANTGVTTTTAVNYLLPLAKPVVTATAGDGKVKLSWGAVKEATKYTIGVGNGHDDFNAGASTSYTVEGLDNLTNYTFTVSAKRGSDVSISDPVKCMPYKPIDTSNAVPGMDIVNQSEENQMSVMRTGGVMSFSQPATSGGIASGKITNSSFVLTPNTLTGNFTVSADVTVEAIGTGTGNGIFFGAFTGTAEKDKLISIAVRGDGEFNAFRTKNEQESTYNNGGSKKGAVTIGKKYTYTLSRTGESYSVSVKDGNSTVVESSWGIKSGKDFVDFSEDLKGEVKAGFVINNATVTIENFKITQGETSVFDSSTLTGSFSSFIDNWESVDAPVISVEGQRDAMTVTSNCVIGPLGAGKVTVEMKDSAGNVVDTMSSSVNGNKQTFVFEPEFSGNYSFVATAERPSVSTKKTSNEATVTGFVSKLHGPENLTATSQGTGNDGKGTVKLEWDSYAEATNGYRVSYKVDGEGEYTVAATTTATTYTVTGLEIDTKYSFVVEALRGEEAVGTTATATATADSKFKWQFSAYGSSTDTKSNGFIGDANDGSVTVFSEGGKGKIVPNSTDGVAFYYTQVPSDKNFVLKSKIYVDSWTLSNGQEGFGLMATDRVAENGNGTSYWNNSYQGIATKVEYYYDRELGKVSDDGTKISMKLGIGSIAKTGVTKDNLSKFEANDNSTIVNQFNTETVPLELSACKMTSGTYNVVGGSTNTDVSAGLTGIREYYMTLTKNNTGYWITYSSLDGTVVNTQKYYDTEALSQIDTENVYVGFFASRNARATFSDISFEIRDPKDDPAPEERPIKYVTPQYTVTSPTSSGTEAYKFTFVSNADGWLTIPELDISGQFVKDGVTFYKTIALREGSNSFTVSFRPDPEFVPLKGDKLSSYETEEFVHTVQYKVLGKENEPIYVSPTGTNEASGTKDFPLDIYTAIKYARPGQKIYLTGGVYKLRSTVKIARGIDGKPDNNIYLMADPQSKERPVLDFQGLCAGMVIAGNYWTLSGFDVTNSADAQKGIQVSGSHNVLSQINTYHNGNTGLQISRLLSTDTKTDWPSYNLILNCTSYGNADKGYEDADGFAAKLTVGDGNVFDGCIAHHNADDGWDLYAKVETGSIGSVTIKNSVAYANGYLEDGTDAGNGNGFKMGGDSLSGYHKLIDSVAYDNKSKGIDSNSCPDIQVTNCTTFNNEKYNVAFYTNTAANTDYSADGVLSYRSGTSYEEQIKPVGSQDKDKIYKDTNYYWDTGLKQSKNKSGDVADDSWFVSLDTSIVPTRNSDGTINMRGLLELTDAAPANVGARIKGQAAQEIIDKPTTPSNPEISPGIPPYGGDSSDDDSSDDVGNGSSGTAEDEYGVLEPTEISGATSTQLNGTDFAEIGNMTDGAAGIVTSIDANRLVKDDVKVEKTTEDVTKTVVDKINTSSDKEIVAYVSEKTSVSKDVFDKLKQTGKTLTLGVVNDAGKITAIVSIDGNKLKNKSVDFSLTVNANVKNNNITKITDKAGVKESSFVIVDFKHSGTLPGAINVGVDVSEKFKDGTKVALYYYNTNKGTLDNQYQITTVKNGFAEFAINHCSQYVLVDVSAAQDTLTSSSTLGSPKTADMTSIFVWILLMCLAAGAVFYGIKMSKKRA